MSSVEVQPEGFEPSTPTLSEWCLNLTRPRLQSAQGGIRTLDSQWSTATGSSQTELRTGKVGAVFCCRSARAFNDRALATSLHVQTSLDALKGCLQAGSLRQLFTAVWIGQDLNLYSPPRQGGVTTRLDHQPGWLPDLGRVFPLVLTGFKPASVLLCRIRQR